MIEHNIRSTIQDFFSKMEIYPEIVISYDRDAEYIISVSINEYIPRDKFIDLSYLIYKLIDNKTNFSLLLFINKILKYKYSTVYLSDYSEIHVDRIIEEVKDLVSSFKSKDKEIRKFLLPILMLEYTNFFSTFYGLNSWRGYTKEQQISYNSIEEE